MQILLMTFSIRDCLNLDLPWLSISLESLPVYTTTPMAHSVLARFEPRRPSYLLSRVIVLFLESIFVTTVPFSGSCSLSK